MDTSYRSYTTSLVGTAHIQHGLVCQDASDCAQVGEWHILAVADGLGSQPFADVGAKLAVKHILKVIEEYLSCNDILDLDLNHCFMSTANHVRKFARRIKQEPYKFATTLQVAVIGDKCSLFGIVGDGGIVYADKNQRHFISDNQVYELVNQTYHLLSPKLSQRMNVTNVTQCMDEVYLFSDGVRDVLIDEQAQQPHEPIFEYILQRINAFGLEKTVRDILTSPQLLSKVDDDLSLAVCIRQQEDG